MLRTTRVIMRRSVTMQLQEGSAYNLPNDLAESYIALGDAERVANPEAIPAKREIKPAGPSETKPVAPSELKKAPKKRNA